MLQLNFDELWVINVVLVSVVNFKKVRWGKPPLRNVNRLYGAWYALENHWNLNISSTFVQFLKFTEMEICGEGIMYQALKPFHTCKGRSFEIFSLYRKEGWIHSKLFYSYSRLKDVGQRKNRSTLHNGFVFKKISKISWN